ncbi:MAG: hypothetical protein ILA24_02640 [Ruminococcus sp.]|jgi:hypothetical protein|nr:hypothetical protein [Ruminococcus sp.]
MKKTVNFKKSLITGFIAAVMLSSLSLGNNAENESWFVTGSILEEKENELTVIDDSDTQVEFRFGLFDLIVDLFS